MNWKISAMTEKDIAPVVSIENLAFPVPWKRSAFMAELVSPIAITQVVRQPITQGADAVIGYICSQLVLDELSLLKVAVAPAWRRRGVGGDMLNQHIETATKRGAGQMFLEVRPSNHGAVAFYLNSGFQVIGKRPYYYPETGEDALVMTKIL